MLIHNFNHVTTPVYFCEIITDCSNISHVCCKFTVAYKSKRSSDGLIVSKKHYADWATMLVV